MNTKETMLTYGDDLMYKGEIMIIWVNNCPDYVLGYFTKVRTSTPEVRLFVVAAQKLR